MEQTDNFAYLLPFIFFVFGTIFLIANRWSPGSARYWGLGYICAAFGFAFPILAYWLPLPIQAIFSNLLFFAAFFSYGQALLVRFNRPTWFWTRFEFAIGAFAVVCWLIVVREDLRSQLVIGDASLAVLLAISVFAVWKHARSPIDKMLVGMASLVVFETAVRVTVLLVSTSAGDFASLDQFLSSDYAFLMQVFASIIGFVMALTVLGSVVFDVVTGHRRAAEHDPLTDLLNRRGFEQALPDAKDGAFPAGAVIIGDIDHFKQVNDRFGHAAGDHVIIGFAERLRASFRNASAIARFGGEEFVTFLPDVSRTDAADMAEEARLAFEAMDWSGQGVLGSITASFGVSTTAPGDHSVHDAIARADACLYVAKNAGRNRVISEGQRPPDSPPTLRVVS
ncbi:diguanylate cyclase (GGDEF) domain-containing protein [Rhizobium sp. NFR07]|uniref:GGDEF domain-containing protein n=1 Tax=Rhizobium sp. NFR07 TaxID=1566262 RepID=UPI0008E18783|nr:GGDEF domain-containing protein [Rhizobium sp. NFR07]SFB25747.1 diguanylate cyclase (GGDEF) domain-containing protein [Rhizobium sp. NFR07]